MSDEILLSGGVIRCAPDAAPAAALLVRDGRVAAVGTEAEVHARTDRKARRIHLRGATVTAGFTDAHVHLTAWALLRRRVDLSGAASPEEAADRIRSVAPDRSGWIRGHGWNRNRWVIEPHRSQLDDARSDVPVFLDSQDLHGGWLNSAALERCGIGRDTPDPAGGRIVRDAESGEPTGLLLENARSFALSRVPEPPLAEVRAALLDAQAESHALGITGVHSVEITGLRDFGDLEAAGKLRLRVLQHIQLDTLDDAVHLGLRSGFGGPWLRVGGVKMFLDGALGSRTAWMREPYLGSVEDRGINTLPPDRFREAVAHAAAHGLASTVHAIGDAAVELAIRTLGAVEPPSALPHRIEHLQLCPPELWGEAAAAGVIASMQPTHLLTDIPAAQAHWGGERSRGAYPFAALERAGVVLAFGSDVPVETIDPRPGLFAARRRATWDAYAAIDPPPPVEWFPEHALTGDRALAAYTIGPAIAAGRGERGGRLLPGCDADLVAWSHDPVTIDPFHYPHMDARLTMVGGEIVFQDPDG